MGDIQAQQVRPEPEENQAAPNLSQANISEIKLLLDPILKGKLVEIFDTVGAFLIEHCKNSKFDIREIWIGARDIGIRRGIFIDIVLGIPGAGGYDEEQQDFHSNLECEVAQKFPGINYSEIAIVGYPYVQHEHAPVLPRLEHPDLWKRIFHLGE